MNHLQVNPLPSHTQTHKKVSTSRRWAPPCGPSHPAMQIINNIFYPMWFSFLKSTFLRQLLPISLRKVNEKILYFIAKVLAFLVPTILLAVVYATAHKQCYRQQPWRGKKHHDRKKNPHLSKDSIFRASPLCPSMSIITTGREFWYYVLRTLLVQDTLLRRRVINNENQCRALSSLEVLLETIPGRVKTHKSTCTQRD